MPAGDSSCRWLTGCGLGDAGRRRAAGPGADAGAPAISRRRRGHGYPGGTGRGRTGALERDWIFQVAPGKRQAIPLDLVAIDHPLVTEGDVDRITDHSPAHRLVSIARRRVSPDDDGARTLRRLGVPGAGERRRGLSREDRSGQNQGGEKRGQHVLHERKSTLVEGDTLRDERKVPPGTPPRG